MSGKRRSSKREGDAEAGEEQTAEAAGGGQGRAERKRETAAGAVNRKRRGGYRLSETWTESEVRGERGQGRDGGGREGCLLTFWGREGAERPEGRTGWAARAAFGAGVR